MFDDFIAEFSECVKFSECVNEGVNMRIVQDFEFLNCFTGPDRNCLETLEELQIEETVEAVQEAMQEEIKQKQIATAYDDDFEPLFDEGYPLEQIAVNFLQQVENDRVLKADRE